MSAVKDLQPAQAQMEKKGKAARRRLKCRHKRGDRRGSSKLRMRMSITIVAATK